MYSTVPYSKIQAAGVVLFFFWNVQVTYLLQDLMIMARPATAEGSGRLLKKARARQLQTRVEIYNDAIPN